jgi:hypothetical protein
MGNGSPTAQHAQENRAEDCYAEDLRLTWRIRGNTVQRTILDGLLTDSGQLQKLDEEGQAQTGRKGDGIDRKEG